MDWSKLDITQEMVIIAIVVLAIFMGDKDVSNVAMGGLIGYLTKKNGGL